MALVSAATAAPADRRQDDCQDEYNKCIAACTLQVKCSCDLTTCSSEDSARFRHFCATVTAFLTLPSKTAIPGGCNPAHPGSYPSSYLSTTKVASPTVPPTQPAGGYPSPRPVSGKTWSIKNLTRYCVERFLVGATGRRQPRRPP
ncbi:hypothetical protein SUNI508_11520 [Seiridium unicorne]|uniref:Extracellular membrane protein CFEM domain-containing protein n=1 Tax=Seiridium unicorne TaxID=138068 RepID=A0ABR2UH61_9PEZI